MKKTGLVLLFTAALVAGLGGCPAEAFTINLSPTFLENRHYADVTAIYDLSQVGPWTSTDKPYAIAELGDRVGNPAELWAYNGRGIKSEVIKNHDRKEGDLIWSEAVIAFGGESGYNLPSSGSFLDSIIGNAESRASYALSLSGGSDQAEVLFSVISYDNTYPGQPGFDAWHSITLKDPSSTNLFHWSGDLVNESIPLTLTSGSIYTLLIESKGDFNDQVTSGQTTGRTFSSLTELKISALELIPVPAPGSSAPELIPVPAPGSLVLLASAFTGWFALRKRIRLLLYSLIL